MIAVKRRPRGASNDRSPATAEQAAGVAAQRHSSIHLRRLGRVALWATVALVFVRGLGAIASPPRQTVRLATQAPAPSVADGDAEAQAFAVDFARAYLSFRPRATAAWLQEVAPFLASGLRDRAAAMLPRRGPGQQVAQATVARVVPLGGTRALITVASTFTTAGRPVRYLSVPVARDPSGGLSVSDLPSLSAPPPTGNIPFEDPPPLAGADAPAIGQLVGRFLGAYLSGQDPSALSYLLVPGASVPAIGTGLMLVSLDSIGQDQPPNATAAVIEAAVHVRDTASGVVYPLRYRLSLVRRDRWYVSSVAGGPQS